MDARMQEKHMTVLSDFNPWPPSTVAIPAAVSYKLTQTCAHKCKENKLSASHNSVIMVTERSGIRLDSILIVSNPYPSLTGNVCLYTVKILL
jgi:hypothetical protein